MPLRVRPITKPRCKNCRVRKVKCDYVKPTFDKDNANQTLAVTTNTRSSAPGRRLRLQSASELPPSIGHSQQQVAFQKFLTRLMPQTAADLDVFEAHWVMQLPDLRRRFKPLVLAVDAFAMAICAKTDPSEDLRTMGMKLYGHALGQLSEYYSNRSGTETRWHEAALTSIVLSLYESTSDDLFTKPGVHLQGVSILLQKGTIGKIRDPRFQSTFSLVRVTMVWTPPPRDVACRKAQAH
ncbi:hypothetical protein LMH87_001542 [Akanthomyces muscarius]|uniref:Zn(2)-C6 fungal-type domain-containing protein n=1 Tax=Akanthomyces muscarius TaxID=2231603 RepID=A0A9W8Q5W0_AKAMU|nr:hypothetical protein LMH87_001542 [Akanthomyces muscarius]KAJ4146989.1 hypothetical protein LMH87_001542 [Akanthomyces muscarius]